MNNVLNGKSQDDLIENKVKSNKVDENYKFDWDWIFEREWLRTK